MITDFDVYGTKKLTDSQLSLLHRTVTERVTKNELKIKKQIIVEISRTWYSIKQVLN